MLLAPCRSLKSMKSNICTSKTSLNIFLSSTCRTRHEALQKLAIFFQHSKDEFGDIPDSGGATPTKYSTLLSITSAITLLKLIALGPQMLHSVSVINNVKMFSQIENLFFFFSFIHSYPLQSAEPPGKFTEFNFFRDSTVVTTYITLTDNGETKRRVLTNLFQDTRVSTLVGVLPVMENNL